MYSTAFPSWLPPLSDVQRDQLLADAALLSLYEVLAAVPDPRSRHGMRYDLPFLLTCLERVWQCAAVALRGKKSKIEEVFLGSACYASQEALLDFSQTR